MTKDRTIVSFNVGGQLYQVRRTLLSNFPDTMLSRSASQHWNNDDGDKTIFIDQDGQRFRYCLEYMRNGTVQLPLTESKSAVLQDLIYYGFQNVDPDTINDSSAIIEATNFVCAHAENAKNKIQAIEQTIRDLQKQKEHEEQALFLFKEFVSGKKHVEVQDTSHFMAEHRERFNFFRNLDMSYFAPILAAHGLKLVNKNTSHAHYSAVMKLDLDCI
jgi:hypothetical protein